VSDTIAFLFSLANYSLDSWLDLVLFKKIKGSVAQKEKKDGKE